MEAKDIKDELTANGLHVWQLIHLLGVSRDKYYRLSHAKFSGYEDEIKHAMTKLINDNQKEAVK